jgi:transposase
MYSDVAQWARIRRQALIGGISQREIANKTGIARKTVRQMVQSPLPLGYRRNAPYPRPQLGPRLEVLDKIIAEDADKPIKQRRTAKETWQWLKTDYGFSGGQSTVRDYVRTARNKTANRSQFDRSSAIDVVPSDPPLTSTSLALAIYEGIHAVPKRQAIKFLGRLCSTSSPQLDLGMMQRVLPKVSRTASEFQKGQVALNWIWKIVQRRASCQSLAEEIGNSPDLQVLLNAASHGRLAVRSRALVILGIKKGFSARRLSDLLCLSRKTVTKYWLSYCQNGWQSTMVRQRTSALLRIGFFRTFGEPRKALF